MSDDILSKLLNRRDWKNFQTQVSPEPENNIEEILKITPINNQVNNFPKAEKHVETKVAFEDEIMNNVIYKKQSKLVNAVNDTETLNELKDGQEIEALSSEKEIKSFSYNHFNAVVSGYRANLAMNSDFKDGKSKKGTRSNSIEKGAQAYFSNDSIDDFLSERGVIYLAGENMSKYTFSSSSNDMKQSLTSSGSSKTSKNFVKNILSLLHKKSKQSPSSDPGQNKDIDLELIHMSRASVYSSTNDSDCLKNLKKDSRTSL
ncbi:homeobox-like protein HDP1 [Maniola hyperantus]|uniref:homeobox-like protein HDP1 n=1 Tax=Aphantopus hyperantus TaxID=2795564 RepID=UPI00374A4C7C